MWFFFSTVQCCQCWVPAPQLVVLSSCQRCCVWQFSSSWRHITDLKSAVFLDQPERVSLLSQTHVAVSLQAVSGKGVSESRRRRLSVQNSAQLIFKAAFRESCSSYRESESFERAFQGCNLTNLVGFSSLFLSAYNSFKCEHWSICFYPFPLLNHIIFWPTYSNTWKV